MTRIRRRLPQDGGNESEQGELLPLSEGRRRETWPDHRGIPVDGATERRDADTLPDPMCMS